MNFKTKLMTNLKAKLQWKSVLVLALGALALSFILPAQVTRAYTYLTCDSGSDKITWSEECNGCARMHVSTTSFPAGNAFTTEVNAAMDTWNAVDRSRFNFVKLLDTDGSHGHNDVNEVYFDDIDGPGDTLARTRRRGRGRRRTHGSGRRALYTRGVERRGRVLRNDANLNRVLKERFHGGDLSRQAGAPCARAVRPFAEFQQAARAQFSATVARFVVNPAEAREICRSLGRGC